MKKDKRPEMTSAMQRSWRPGGPSRIAYDKRMQEKKTAPLVHPTSQPTPEVVGQPKAPIEIPSSSLLYRAAAMLLLSNATFHRNHAIRLIDAADTSLGIDE